MSFCVQPESVYLAPISTGTVLSPATLRMYSAVHLRSGHDRHGQSDIIPATTTGDSAFMWFTMKSSSDSTSTAFRD